MESQRAITWTLTPKYIVFNCSFFFMENINLKSTSLRQFGVPPGFFAKKQVARLCRSVPCGKQIARMQQGDHGGWRWKLDGAIRPGNYSHHYYIITIIIIFSDEVSMLIIHFPISTIHHYLSNWFHYSIIPVLIFWRFTSGDFFWLELSAKVFFFTENIHANGGVNGVRASVKI